MTTQRNTEVATERKAKARQLVAYLTYAVEEVRALSPMGSYLLEMSIAAFSEDMNLPHQASRQGVQRYC